MTKKNISASLASVNQQLNLSTSHIQTLNRNNQRLNTTCGAGLGYTYMWGWTVPVGLDCDTPTCGDGMWYTYLRGWTVTHLPMGLDCGTPACGTGWGTPTCGDGLWYTYLWGWNVVHLPAG
jgi:hypothetical protein